MARRKTVTVEVTDRGAVYVNGTRITGRHTKWGIHTTIFKTTCPADRVAETLRENNYGRIVLEKEYLEEMGIM
jgi:hypothetical protein